MPRRLAACESCRGAKVACDHATPQCSRCRQDRPDSVCIYRDRPFKKRKRPTAPPQVSSDRNVSRPSNVNHISTRGPYPNPGYLGSSSHDTIFKRLDASPRDPSNTLPSNVVSEGLTVSTPLIDDILFTRAVRTVEQARALLDFGSCNALITEWLSTGFNLALAGPLVTACAESAVRELNRGTSPAVQTCEELFTNSARPISAGPGSAREAYCDNFCSLGNVRWETIGIFFLSLSRAVNDMQSFNSLFRTREERRSLQKLTLALADECLEIVMSLDCLNDLQLVFQYENFIAHSVANGDQSYHSWRRLGDVIGTLFALGYHEHIDNAGQVSDFRKDLRRAALARVYSADKNIAIFLGRPLRLQLRNCHSQLPLLGEAYGCVLGDTSSAFQTHWPPSDQFDYLTETRWTALCAMMKERVIDLSEEHDEGRKLQRVRFVESSAAAVGLTDERSDIRAQAYSQWHGFPARFRWDGVVMDLHDRKAIEQDFMISARLNYLHIDFLLGLATARNLAEPDKDLVSVAAVMLHLAVDAILFKERLINSGTGLVWKIAHYGLPAAGVLCLSLLNHLSPVRDVGLSMVNKMRSLTLLVAQIEAGVLVDLSDPNYALFAKAAQAINSVLHRVITRNSTNGAVLQSSNVQHQSTAVDPCPDWMPWSAAQNTYDFELDFWLHLGEHPELALLNDEISGLL